MTTDAKIGLLLGLVFILIIAFIINGLPGFAKGRDAGELNKDYLVELQGYSPGLTDKAREVAGRINRWESDKRIVPVQVPAKDSVRYRIDLPPVTPTAARHDETNVPPVPAMKDVTPANQIHSPQQAAPKRVKFYVVQEGDNLSTIAKSVYGPEEGNKKANIDRIYQKNRKVLDLPNEVFPGQKLLIPVLPSQKQGIKIVGSFFSKALFEKVSSIGRKTLPFVAKTGPASGKHQDYIVKEQDSLWRIAAEQLGDGARYTEIAELNADVLDDENRLGVGMRLKLPGR